MISVKTLEILSRHRATAPCVGVNKYGYKSLKSEYTSAVNISANETGKSCALERMLINSQAKSGNKHILGNYSLALPYKIKNLCGV